MPAISFQHKFTDALLSGDKQQTTRQQTDRFKVGDIAHIYIEQRRRIAEKPLQRLTDLGFEVMRDRHCLSTSQLIEHEFHAHFLGKAILTEVYDMRPCDMSGEELKAWALADGFKSFYPIGVFPEQLCAREPGANTWFTKRYGDDWTYQRWTVIKWEGWLERYFEAEAKE